MAKAAEIEDLPRAIVRRLVKEKLSECSNGEDFNVNKEALIGFSESARIFIHYISATANDICKESKRQTISADDVLKALEEIEYPEFIDTLKNSLEDFRQKNTRKRAATQSKGSDKKRKTEKGLDNDQETAGEDIKDRTKEDENEASDEKE